MSINLIKETTAPFSPKNFLKLLNFIIFSDITLRVFCNTSFTSVKLEEFKNYKIGLIVLFSALLIWLMEYGMRYLFGSLLELWIGVSEGIDEMVEKHAASRKKTIHVLILIYYLICWPFQSKKNSEEYNRNIHVSTTDLFYYALLKNNNIAYEKYKSFTKNDHDVDIQVLCFSLIFFTIVSLFTGSTSIIYFIFSLIAKLPKVVIILFMFPLCYYCYGIVQTALHGNRNDNTFITFYNPIVAQEINDTVKPLTETEKEELINERLKKFN